MYLTDDKLADILSGCPLLKELSLEDCHGLRKPKFCSAPSIEFLNLEKCNNLKKPDLAQSDIEHLTIDNSGHLELVHLELVCPNVMILDIAGRIEGVKATDMSSLVDTSLYFTSLLRSSHFLETLTIYVYTGKDDDNFKFAKAGWKLAFEFNGFSYWSSVNGTFPCLEHQLKHVKIYGYVLEPDVIELVEFLLKNAQVQEKMEISTKKTLQRTLGLQICNIHDSVQAAL
ncbi:hypothetical protein NL676_033746 [Syzygium grande]|nr:hypothetical protein NL676_033746 [Syzygium grande]